MPRERNDWYYWTKNKHAHFIRFRESDCQVAQATIKALSDDDCREAWVAYGSYKWRVTGPCWSTYHAAAIVRTLDEAKKAVDERVMKIIAEEFQPEYVNPLG